MFSCYYVLLTINNLQLTIYNLIRRLFNTTDTELNAIAAPAIIGSNVNPLNGNNTPAAIGMPNTLYTKAQNKFCLMPRIVCLDKANAFGTERKSDPINVMCDTSIAISEPRPIAMLTSANAKAS